MKKLLALILAALMCVMMFAACDPKEDASDANLKERETSSDSNIEESDEEKQDDSDNQKK